MILDRLRFGGLFVQLLLATWAGAQNPESGATRPLIPENVTFELLAPAAESRPTESRGNRAVALIRITNKNAAAVTLWPFVSLEVRDSKGNEIKPSSHRGRFGRRRHACFLEGVDFVTVQPGKSIEWPVRPDLYTRDPDAIVGWKLASGEYTLTARHAYSRSDFLARCKLGCESHADGRRPWNAALEITRTASLKITVK